MLAKVHSFGVLGIDTYPVEIEVDVSPGLPNITIVGRPEIDIAVESPDIGIALQIDPIAAGGRAGGQVLRAGRQGHAPIIAG